MKNRKVNSREYKIMLKAKKFQGDEDELSKKIENFWYIFSNAIAEIIPTTKGKLAKAKTQTVSFYDTQDQILKKHSYVFRERINVNDNKREVTLKFRHRDRYLSQAREMKDKDGKDKKQKFEEDIKPPVFVSLYSFSNKVKIDADKKLNQLNDPGRLFPDLPKRLGKYYNSDQEIKIVNDFTAYQIVFDGTSFSIEHKTDLKCESALIIWYTYKLKGNQSKIYDNPVVAEFSFKYKDESGTENFSAEAANTAYKVFQILQKDENLQEWIDLEGPTKTKFAYEYS